MAGVRLGPPRHADLRFLRLTQSDGDVYAAEFLPDR